MFTTNSITNWRVLNETSMSDHQTIVFDIEGNIETVTECRNPKKTDWDLYTEMLRAEFKGSTPQNHHKGRTRYGDDPDHPKHNKCL